MQYYKIWSISLTSTALSPKSSPMSRQKGLTKTLSGSFRRKKNEPAWLLEFRLKAYQQWLKMEEPKWPNVKYPKIDFQAISYYSAPKPKKKLNSMDEVDPELLRTFEKLGVPMHERAALAGVAVDVIFDSVSVATTYKQKLAEVGIIFCSISEAVQMHPDLVKQYLGTVVPVGDNYYAALNSAVFTDGTFCFIPKGVKCPMDLSTYFRINTEESGQFERTLIIAEEGASVSYLEGCTAPKFDTNQLHAAVVELVALDNADIKYSTVQNWYAGDENGLGGIYNFVTKRGLGQGRQFAHFVDPGRNRLGDYLEISLLHSAGRQLGRRILFGRGHQQLSAGRHRHQDDPYRQKYAQHDRQQGYLGGAFQQQLPRAGQNCADRRRRAQLFAMRLDADRRPMRRQHLSLHPGSQPGAPRSSMRHRRRRSAKTSCFTLRSAASATRKRYR